MRHLLSYAILIVLALGIPTARAEEAASSPLIFQSGPLQNTTVHLFTSDGNANCNPAVEWLNARKEPGAHPELWRQVVPVAFHVKLWDIPGYKDAFARTEFDEMLLAYKKKWSAQKVYAPTVVVNGVEWSGWARSQDIPLEASRRTGILAADGTKRENIFEVTFKPEPSFEAGDLELHGVLMAFGLQSRPTEGKNRGKALTHDFVPLVYKKTVFRNSLGNLIASVDLPRTKGIRVQRYAAAFWITRVGDPLPLQATGNFLSS